MAGLLDAEKTLRSLDHAVGELDQAVAFGREVAPKIDRIFLVSCGSGYAMMWSVEWWAKQLWPKVEVQTFQASKFIDTLPPLLDERTLLLLGSKSGETTETLAVARGTAGKCFKRVVFTKNTTSQLAANSDKLFLLGQTTETFLAMFMQVQVLVAAICDTKVPWALFPKLLSSLRHLPAAAVDAWKNNKVEAKADAELCKDETSMSFIAAGPGDTSAYVLGMCVLGERWIIKHPIIIDGYEYGHGWVEEFVPDETYIVFLGEDDSRSKMEKVKAFLDEGMKGQASKRLIFFDSKRHGMDGIDEAIRPIVGPYVNYLATKPFARALA